MKTVFKYSMSVIDDAVSLMLPAGAELLTVQMQHSIPCLWARVDTDAPKVLRKFHWRGTGHPNADCGEYVGTIQQLDGRLVFHLFAEPA